jgi:hypothetical protein
VLAVALHGEKVIGYFGSLLRVCPDDLSEGQPAFAVSAINNAPS